MVDRYAEAKAAVERGWILTPLRGKIPQLGEWQNRPAPGWDQVKGWLDAGYNLGLVTGAASGVYVVDIDTAKGATIPEGLPPTVTVRTGSGGLHYYYRAIPGLGNSASKLAPHVDTRGDGGQVVFVGSIHPDTRQSYTWETPPGDLAVLPPDIVSRIRPVRINLAAEPASGRRLLLSEVSAVRTAQEGTRNARLNKAAYTLGGCLDIPEDLAVSELVAAAEMCGLPEREARITIRSGFNAGRLAPMRERAISRLPMVAETTYVRRDTGEVLALIPGSHYLEPDKYLHVTTDRFAETCLAMMPDGLVCRRGGLPGVLQGKRGSMTFEPLEPSVTRILLDRHLRLAWLKEPDDGEAPIIVHKYAVRDHGEIFLAGARLSEAVPTLDAVVHWPTLLADDTITPPGWGKSGVYYDEPLSLEDYDTLEDPYTREALLRDLLTDFPLASEADIEAFWALLLTPIVRVAIHGPAPLFLVSSPQERTGKTKLVELVLGMTIQGEPIPATQLGSNTEEHDKRLISLLLCGANIVHLDNLSEYLDSAPLASLLTSHQYQARILGRSSVVSLPNHMTMVATGNNPKLSGELANRSVHIRLQTTVEDPARRINFKHPDLPAFIRQERPRIVGALVGMVLDWIHEGKPPGNVVLGGFEAWASTVGGILALQAMRVGRKSQLLQDAAGFVRDQDDRTADLRALVEAWATIGGHEMKASELLSMAREREIFTWIDGHSQRAENTSFGMVMVKAVGRIIGPWRIDRSGTGSKCKFRLCKAEVAG